MAFGYWFFTIQMNYLLLGSASFAGMEQDRAQVECKKIHEFADLKGKTVLEIGCGNGRASAMLAQTAKALVAIDPDAEQIIIARSAVSGVDFRLGSGENLDFEDGTFDTLVFTFSLHHQDSVKALSEAHRVLKPGGQLLIIEPSMEGLVHQFFRLFRNEDRQIAAALEAIRNCDFEPEREETFPTELWFDDNEEIYDYFFNHYKMTRASEFIIKMDRLLGDKIGHRPIVLVEMVTLFSLGKR
jgi:SAM-dependent methyltransferase